MRIYRGDDYALTDSVQPGDYLEDWKAGHGISLDGTKDKSGAKQTRLRIEIDDADVLALFYGLVERYRQAEAKLRKLEKVRFGGKTPEGYINEIKAILSETKNA
jgi:hypothetical protein